MCSPERCWRFAKDTAYQGKSRSVSPRKRPHPDAGAAVDSDDDWVEAEFRGRKRRRDDGIKSCSSSELSNNESHSAELSVETPGTPPASTSKIASITGLDFDMKEVPQSASQS